MTPENSTNPSPDALPVPGGDPGQPNGEIQPTEQPLPDEELAKMAYAQITRLKEINTLGKARKLLGKPISELEELAREERHILSWFSEHLGNDKGTEHKLTHQVSLIETYIIDKSDDEATREFFHNYIVKPLRDPDTSGEPTPILWEATRAFDLEKLKQMAKRGIVVQWSGERQVDRDPKTGKLIGKRYPYSDLDGNISLWLLKEAGVINKDTPVHYVKHEDMYAFMENNPKIGIVIDISEESLNNDLVEAGQPHRDSLASRLVREFTGEKINTYGRIYFEHHGDKSSPDSGCSAMKVYDWLRQLDALPAPEIGEEQLKAMTQEAYMKVVKSERNRGVQIKHIVDFVDAQDNRNYYPAPDDPNKFEIEQTLTNAFGLKQARVTDDETGAIIGREWWGDYQPGQVAGDGYRERFLLLMALTGKDYKRQFDLKLLEKIVEIKNPEATIANSRKCTVAARNKIQQWRQGGKIQRTPSGGEIFIDQRNWIASTGKSEVDPLVALGVDPSDMLISEGIRSRMITGLDQNGDIQSITAFAYHDSAMMEKFVEMQRELGGQVARNSIYNFRASKNTQ